MAFTNKFGQTRGYSNAAVGSQAGVENATVGAPPPIPLGPGYTAPASVTSITRSSLTATLTATAHGCAVGDVILIAGADQVPYNGYQKVLTVPTADTLTFEVYGSPASASGTVTFANRFRGR